MKKLIFIPLAASFLFGCETLPSKDVSMATLSNDLPQKQIDVVYTRTQMITTFPEDGLEQFDGLFGLALQAMVGNPKYELKTIEEAKDLPLWQKILIVHDKQPMPDRIIPVLFNQDNIRLSETPLKLANSREETLNQVIKASQADYIALVENSGIFGPRILSPLTQYITYASEVKLIETASGAVVWQDKCHIGPGEGDGQEVHRDDVFKGEGKQLESAMQFVAEACIAELKPKLATIGL
ncbi:hypothetical protein K6Y31_07495 [Motilimonas cestriensis]|uniref:Lipoprotein n=1 Tax=Motilimonas cestriensis TaxID=2742685 RepID=A0ABS8W984_9GAMM|nr:hypothetical protein [Motilimonas cestriensis]MCE2594657.1 hypothetical protein [Motilimonas cestriensis]